MNDKKPQFKQIYSKVISPKKVGYEINKINNGNFKNINIKGAFNTGLLLTDSNNINIDGINIDMRSNDYDLTSLISELEQHGTENSHELAILLSKLIRANSNSELRDTYREAKDLYEHNKQDFPLVAVKAMNGVQTLLKNRGIVPE